MSQTRLIPYASLEASPWKNGGGSTTELAVSPPGAGLDEFCWRLSLATIAQSGPFSVFNGIDRTLALVEGEGVRLDIDDRPVRLDADNPVVEFAGEAVVRATVGDGVTTDFNVMTRRSDCTHQLGRRRLDGISEFAPRGDVTVLFLADGEFLELNNDDERIGMVRFDTVLFEPGSRWTLNAGAATVFVVDIYYK